MDKPVNLLIWTTTPWTLPLNRAVLLKPNTRYVILDVNGTYVVTAKQLAASVAGLVGAEPKIIHEFTSDELVEIGAYAMHPFIEGQKTPIILDQSVLVDEGTAAVHNAPGCGPEDYEVGVKNNLEIFSPISPDGKYTVGIKPTELEGMPVVDGQIWVIKKLVEVNRLYFKTNIKHSYPHCWRCHSPLIFRATKQWFCDLSKGNLRDKVLQAIDTIVTLPEKSINRLKATVEGRLEWCLSRQRVWGTPIPAIICTNCDYTYLTHQHIEKVAAEVEKHGIEYWDTADLSTLLPADFSCPVCKEKKFVKEHDILDVWFDSGISHYAVLAHNPDLRFPADVYLEGKDQHRGWFQSSLLTAMVLEKAAPMKMIITHGFTVDDKGRKMSKSLGNGVEPQEIIDQLGTDGLRLWASAIDCADDAVVSKVLLQNVAEVFRKIRNTCRFLVSNLYDFDYEQDALPIEKLLPLDRYALQRLRLLNDNIMQAYADMNFTAIFHYLADYCSVELSSFYLDIIKDRLYTEKADGHARRSAQTTCWIILDTLTKLFAPVLSFTAEQISDQYQKNKKESIHLQPFASLKTLEQRNSHAQEWEQMLVIRSALLKAIELARAANVVSHSREARLTIWFDDSLRTAIAGIFDELKSVDQSAAEFFKEFMIVSAVEIASSNAGLEKTELVGLYARVEKSTGVKCPRCWQYTESNRPDGLCDRCAAIIGE
jgi:isoleucyl-tRNA synthetase